MCKFIGKSNERIFCKLRQSEILRSYSIVHFAMETTKTSNFSCQSKSFISIIFTCQVSACELQPFSCHHLANDIYPETAKPVFSHFNIFYIKPEIRPVKSLTLKPIFLPCSFWPPKGFSASGRTVTVSRFTAFSGSREAICSADPFQLPSPIPTTQNLWPWRCQGCCSHT